MQLHNKSFSYFWKQIKTSWAALESNSKSSWPSRKWWVTVLRKVTTIPGMVVDHSTVGGWPSMGWCATVFEMVGDHPLEIGWPSLGRLVTIFWILNGHPWNGGWTFLGWWLTILGMVGDHPGDGSLSTKFYVCSTLPFCVWPSFGLLQGCKNDGTVAPVVLRKVSKL